MELPLLSSGEKPRYDTATEAREGPQSELIDALLQTISERQTTLYKDLNDLAEAVMLATAKGANLDQAAAILGVKRQQLNAADDQASPPTTALMESDERFRLRARYSVQALNHSGCEGSYRFCALSASANIKDVSVYSRDWLEGDNKINVVVLHDDRNEAVTETREQVLAKVRAAVLSVASITDDIEVRWATVVPYRVSAMLEFQEQSDKSATLERVNIAVNALIKRNHQLGKNIVRDEFLAELYQPGVERVILVEPANDLAIPADAVAHNNSDIGFRIEEAEAIALATHTDMQTSIRLAQYVQLQTDLGEDNQ